MSSNLARSGLRAPVNLTWEITFKCNLHCRHCLSASGPAATDELTTEECIKVLDELARLRVFQINIGGGEPFMRPDFLDLLKYAHEKGIVACVSTNGTLIDADLAATLSKMTMLFLQISLDGATASVNDEIRGQGTYRKILQAAENLAGQGVRFSFNTVLTKQSYPQLDELRSLAANYFADLRVSRFRPSGRGKSNNDQLKPDKEQLESFAGWLSEHDMIRTGDSFFSLTSEKRRRQGLDMCGAAKMTCCLSPTGEVYPCAFLQEPEFKAGDIRQQSLSDIWRHSKIFDEFRNMEVGSCESCYRFESCRGGCPAVAYHTYNELNQPDPECMRCLGLVAA